MPPQQQDMTYSPAHGQNQNQIVAAIRSSNPPHPDPSISPPPPSPPPTHLPKQPPATATAAHAPPRRDRSLRASQTSTVTTDIPGSLSGSSSASYKFAKGLVVDTRRSSLEQQQHPQQQQPPQQLLQHPHILQQQALFVNPNLARASAHGNQYDGRRESRGERYRRSRAEGWSSPRSMSAGSPHRTHYRVSNFPGDEDDLDDGLSEDQGENAFIILLKISFLVPPYSLFAALYTFFVLLFTTLLSPLRLLPKSGPFAPSKSYTTQLADLLSPPLHIHKSLINSDQNHSPSSNPYPYSSRLSAGSSCPNRNANFPVPPSAAMYSLPTLTLVHLLSPVLSLGLLLASWTAAFFWVFAMMLGNPDGTERRDDGRAAVLGVRNWWRAWLKKAG